MTTNAKRLYKTKDVEMIITAATIIEAAISNKTFLQSKRTTWADPFFEDLQARINAATQQYLGVDSAKQLREATQAVFAIQNQALAHLAEAKVQITEDFKNNPVRQIQVLTQLGFRSYHKGAQNKDQEALINLLYQFKTNLSPELKDEIVSLGTASETLDKVVHHADNLSAADISQEGHKGTRREITAAAINEFNEIYEGVISVAKISVNFFKSNPALKAQFSFNNVSKAINAGKNYTSDL